MSPLISTGRTTPLFLICVCPCFTRRSLPHLLPGSRARASLQRAHGEETASRRRLHLPDTLRRCNLFGSCPFPGPLAKKKQGPVPPSSQLLKLSFAALQGAPLLGPTVTAVSSLLLSPLSLKIRGLLFYS